MIPNVKLLNMTYNSQFEYILIETSLDKEHGDIIESEKKKVVKIRMLKRNKD